MLTDDGRTDDGVTGILIAHLRAFGSGELKNKRIMRFLDCPSEALLALHDHHSVQC